MRVTRWHWRTLLVVTTALLVGGCALFGGARPLDEAIKRMPRTARPVRLVVNGEEIPAAAVDRANVYFFGRADLERKIRDFLVADEIELRRRSGQAVEALRIGDEELRKEVASRREELQEEIQGGQDLDAYLRALGMDEASLADEQASLLRLDKVFIPEDRTKWSEKTVQLIGSGAGQEFVDQFMKGRRPPETKGHRSPVIETPAGGEFKDKVLQALVDREIKAIQSQGEWQPDVLPAPLIFNRASLRLWVMKALKESVDIKRASDGLPPDVVLTVNGRPLLTAEIYPTMARRVTALDRERVVRWIAWATATRHALVKAGVYLPEEAFAKEWKAHAGPYEKTPFSFEVLATAFMRFPSYDLYREYFRLRKSFEKLIEKEVTDEALLRHRDRVEDLIGDGKVDAQVILLSAFQFTEFSWKTMVPSLKGSDAFDKAKARAEEVIAALKAGTSFEEAIDRFSEFVDHSIPPPPDRPGRAFQEGPRTNRGRFGPQSKNQLKTLLGESAFDEIVRGTSLGEILFHEAAPREVVGPMRGPLGWYIGRVVERLPGAKKVDFADENSRKLLREDYITRRFVDWSAGVVAESKFKIR